MPDQLVFRIGGLKPLLPEQLNQGLIVNLPERKVQRIMPLGSAGLHISAMSQQQPDRFHGILYLVIILEQGLGDTVGIQQRREPLRIASIDIRAILQQLPHIRRAVITIAESNSLQELVIPDGVKEVRFFARDCTSLERIVLPASMNKISEYAFKECPNLRELILSEKNTAYKVVDGCLIHVSTKTLIAGTCNAVIPTDGSVTAIAENAFYSRNITSMVIPEGITSIGENCFRNCKLLEEVRIREGVVKIDQYAFYDCKNLQRIYLSSTVSFLGNKIFQNCTALTEVYLEGNVKKWQTMTQGLDQTDVKYTVYCKNGMIEPDGTVTLYDDPET